MDFEFGLDTFGDVTVDDAGNLLSHAEVLSNVVDEAVLADSLGIDHFGVGEHHREDFAVSAPEVLLAAIASLTSRIRLGSSVTVLSSDDPVRVYQRFATLDAVSHGRAQVTVGRGSFTESFPLFGYALEDYEVLFEEKLDLFAQLRSENAIDWSGTMRAPLKNQHVYPTTKDGFPVWVGVGGSPESVIRAARYGLPMMLAIIGGNPARFAPYVELFQQTVAQDLPVGVHSPGFVADSNEAAREVLYPHFKIMRDRIGAERGWPPITRDQYEHDIDHGSLYVGDSKTVAQKIANTIQVLDIQRFDLKYSAGTLPHPQMMRSIELYGAEVIPRVRALLHPASS